MDTPANTLIITERPNSLLFAGAILCGFGLVMLVQHEAPTLMGAIFGLIGGFLLVNSPTATAKLDKTNNLLVLHSRAVIRQHTQEIPLSEIVEIELQARHGSRTYRLVFITRENTIVPMTGYYSGGKTGKMQQVEQLRLFLGLTSTHHTGIL